MKESPNRLPENTYQLMAQYNRWMNLKIFTVCEDIPDSERKRDMGAFFKSIHGTLNHILYGDIAWLERLRDNSYKPRNVENNLLYADFEALKGKREETDREIIEWADSLYPEYLKQDHTYKSNVDNKTRNLPVWVLATHMFNHQTHHRGQVTTLIKQLGYEPGVTDIPWLSVLNDMN